MDFRANSHPWQNSRRITSTRFHSRDKRTNHRTDHLRHRKQSDGSAHFKFGTQLLNSLIAKAKKLGLKRIWGITTNDNLEAIQFYKNRGFRIAATYLNAIALSRKLKPEIPEIGLQGIPIRDEIEIEHSLTD